MGKQIFSIKGMTRDLDPAKSPSQYAYEIRNLRLTAQEDSTMLALVSEKGNAQYQILDENNTPVSLHGAIIGYCVLHNYLTVFTYDSVSSTPDRIYRLEMHGMTMTPLLLYEGNLGFGDTGVKIEAIGIYENTKIQKVYWIDGVHQPRFINIVDENYASWNDESFDFVPTLKMNESVSVVKSPYNGVFNAGTIQYILTYYNKNGQQSAAFYQSPINYISHVNKGASPEDTVSNSFEISIKNVDTDYDYVRVYSVFRSSENGTPVCKKVADLDIKGSTLDSVPYIQYDNITWSSHTTEYSAYWTRPTIPLSDYIGIIDSSNIEVDLGNFLYQKIGDSSYYLVDSNYKLVLNWGTSGNYQMIQASEGSYLALYVNNNNMTVNLVGTSLDWWQNVQADRNEREDSIPSMKYIDNGLSGETVTYSEILYAGGANIVPYTMAQKNQTLFFGNYKTVSIPEADKETIKNHSKINFGYSEQDISKGSVGSYYMYENQLDRDSKYVTTFKGGETYHFGIILQDKYGAWTDVIPVGKCTNNYYPKDDLTHPEYCHTVKAYITFDTVAKAIVDTYIAVKVVRLDTLPSVVYQGVLCPTVFNHSRDTNSPYCQSSWFFREVEYNDSADQNHRTQNIHNGNIYETIPDGVEASEIQGALSASISYYQHAEELVDNDFFVDWNTLTLNSPDIEFGHPSSMRYNMRIVGILPITSGRTSMLLTLSTPQYNTSLGLDHQPLIHNNLDTEAYQMDLSSLCYRDGEPISGSGTYLYPVYPWHRNGSMTAQTTPNDGDDWYAMLDTKVMATLRESASTLFMDPLKYNITDFHIYQDDNIPVRLEEDTNNYLFPNSKIYKGSVDTILLHNGSSRTDYEGYGMSDGDISTITQQLKEPVRMRYKSTKHGVFSLKSIPNTVYILPNVTSTDTVVATDDLYSKVPIGEVKLEVGSSQVVSDIVSGVSTSNLAEYDIVMVTGASRPFLYIKQIVSSNSIRIWEIDDEFISHHSGYTKDNKHIEEYGTPGTSYWSNENYYDIYITKNTSLGTEYYKLTICEADEYEVDPMYGNSIIHTEETFVNSYEYLGILTDEATEITGQYSYPVESDYAYMYIAELFTDDDLSPSYENGSWYVASEPVKTGKYCVEASIGDTYYQRYDCLKTYPYSLEDQNQIVEIFSFMCESRINIDGRYDNLRGMADNTSVLSTNFNLLNKAYTQNDNFFTYNYLGSNQLYVNEFPNQIIWTKTKVYGSDIDAWTQIMATSTLDMDGSLGEIRSLKLWNDNLLCFQDTGIAKIMYNERTTFVPQQGVPVEIANSGKVDGSHYISNTVGCKNKDSIQVTQGGIYFVDSNKRELYRLSQGLEPLSKSKGFNTYFYDKAIDIDSIKSFYDGKLQDVYFRIIKNLSGQEITECLVYNEQLGEFTSFFDYDMDFMFQYQDSLVSVEHNSSNLWKQFEGNEYLRYFDEMYNEDPVYKEYSIELVSSENPTVPKIFTGVEFRADALKDSITQSLSQATETSAALSNLASVNKLPFKTLRVWNEYQDTGESTFDRLIRKGANLSQKFRIWRADIGRDINDTDHRFNRIVNPWARLRFKGGGEDIKTVIHDIGVMYV